MANNKEYIAEYRKFMKDLSNPWKDWDDDPDQTPWDELSDDAKRESIKECYGGLVDFTELYSHTPADEQETKIVTDWFNGDGRQVAHILMNDFDEEDDPNAAAAEYCLTMAKTADKSWKRLAAFLLEQKDESKAA